MVTPGLSVSPVTDDFPCHVMHRRFPVSWRIFRDALILRSQQPWLLLD